jgi:hypothetical protein
VVRPRASRSEAVDDPRDDDPSRPERSPPSVGSPEVGGFVNHVDAYGIDRNASQPIPRRIRSRVRRIGELRIPIAGPYRPRARLYLFPDGRTTWVVRLWEYDRPVVHTMGSEVLREYARRNGLAELRAEIDRLTARARAEARRAGP